MAFIQESVEFDSVLTVEVLEKEKNEYVEPWEIVNIELAFSVRLSPKKMRELGKWLINQGKRIGREYNSNGKKKKTKDAQL